MKSKVLILVTVLITMLAFTITVNAADKRGKQKQGSHNDRSYKKDRGSQQNRGGYQNDQDQGHHNGYHMPRGWNKHRRQQPRIPNYRYHHDWKRWSDWNRHYRRNPHRYPGGKYHYDRSGSLQFSYCDPDSGACFSFSFFD